MGLQILQLEHGLHALVSQVWRRVQSDDCVDLAAQMSFYFALSLLPFCLVLAMVVGWLPSTALWTSFATWMVTYLPRQSRQLLLSTILGLVNYSTSFLSLGLITAVWSASAGFVSMMESLSLVYGAQDERPYWRKHAIAACATLLAIVFMIAVFGLMALGRWGFDMAPERLKSWRGSHAAWEIGRWIVTTAVICLAIDLINFVLPVVRRPWRWLTPGTAFVIVTLLASSESFTMYFQRFSSYSRIYGALGGFIILMLWIYTGSLILLIGAEADCAIEQLAAESGTD
jgi:membrane protein